MDAARLKGYAKGMGDLRAGSDRWLGWAALVVLLAGVGLRAVAFSPLDIGYSDELMQYLEQGNRLATGHGIIPWEYRYGARNALIPQLLAGPLWLGHQALPGTLWPVRLARGLYAGLCALAMPAAWRLGGLVSARHGLVALVVAATWWEIVLFSDLLLSESLAATLLLGAAALLLDAKASTRGLAVAGLLLGLAVLVRLQYAVFAGVLALAALRLDGRRWRWVVIGGLVAGAVGAVSDLAAGFVPYRWVWVNFGFNIGSGRAARFGAEWWGWYGPALLLRLGGALGVVILALGLFAGRRFAPLLLAAAANFAVHSAVTHKEYRFVWASVLAWLVCAGIGSVNLAERRRVLGRRGVLVVAALWLAASAFAAKVSGGAAMERGGGQIPTLAIAAAREPEVCAIAVANRWRAHVVPALLPRRVPLLVVPEGGPIPVAGANALLLPGGAHAGYRAEQCLALPNGEPVCLYRRAGACTPAPDYSYQRALEKEDL